MAKKTPQKASPARRAPGAVAKKAPAGKAASSARPAARGSGRPVGRRSAAPAGVSDGGNKAYLIGAVATLGGVAALFVLVTVMGGNPKVKDRFEKGGTTTTASTNQNNTRTRARGNASMGPSMANRDVGRQLNEEDEGLEDRQAAAAAQLQAGRRGWDITQIRVTSGDPETVTETYLNELRDKDKIERFDKVKEIEIDHDMGREMVLYYVVNPWDLVKGPPAKAPRELLRFTFAPGDANVSALRDELESLPREEGFERQRADLEERIREASGANGWLMAGFERVEPRDSDYAKYMPRNR